MYCLSLLTFRSKFNKNMYMSAAMSSGVLFSSNINIPKMTQNTSRNYKSSFQFRKHYNSKPSCSSSSRMVVHSSDEEEILLVRPVKTTFGRSLWAEDSFSSENDQIEEEYAEEIEPMKERVRNMVIDTKNYTRRDKMVLIDTLERFDIAYHFEQEIEDQIKRVFEHYSSEDRDDSDLFTTALYFRMFRQHGFDVSCSVFDKFKDENSSAFKEAICSDIEGLLSLYEASFLRFNEETVLRDARNFATHYLNQAKSDLKEDSSSSSSSSSSYLKDKIERALKQPLHWALPKVEARYYMSIYERKETKDETLLRLAKLDFHVMQNMYKKEMHQVQKWWYGFDVLSKLPYTRDCVVQCYFWAAGFNFEPKYSRSRIAAAKMLVVCVLINDTYDSYGILDELQVFIDVFQRWDPKYIGKLPKYLKIVYNTLLRAFEELEREMSEQGRSYTVAYVREALSRTVSAFHKRTEWFNGKEIGTFQDHIDHMGITSGEHQLLAAFYMHVESASRDAFEWLLSTPTSVEEAALYCRYLNDMTSYERKRDEGQYPVAVDTYMEENGVSVKETKEKFAEFAEASWMTLNKEWIFETSSHSVPEELLKPVINFCRIAFTSYGCGFDCFSRPEGGLDASINALLVDPILM